MKKQLNEKIVKDYWRYMTRKYGLKTINPLKQSPHEDVLEFLTLIGIKKPEQWFKTHVITFYGTVYCPYEIGKGSQYQLRQQIKTITHECKHAIDQKNKPVRFALRYATNKTKRANLELTPLGCNLEMDYFLTGRCSPKREADKLKGYCVDAIDVACVHKALIINARIIKKYKGKVIIQEPSKVGIKWLKRRGI